jgi:hypothetical protein
MAAMIHGWFTKGRPRGAQRLMAATACAAALALVAGCGSSSSSSSGASTNASDAVAKAAAASTGAQGYKMTMSMKISSPALPHPVTADGNGAFNVQDKSGTFTIAMNFGNEPQISQVLGSSTLTMQEIIKAPIIYVKLPSALASKIPGGKPWLKIDLAKAASAAGIPGFSSLLSNPTSSDPSQLLQYLRATSGSVTQKGTDTIGGVQTTHYSASIDLDKVPNALPAAQQAAARQGVAALEKATNLKVLPVDVWIDSDNHVRQMQMTFGTSAQGQKVSTAMTIKIPEYGPQSIPPAPPDSQVNDLSSLLGAAGAGQSTSTTGTSTP